MSGKSMNFGDKNIRKSKFYKNKKALKIQNIDFNKILVSKEEPYGVNKSIKYFIGYNYNDDIRPLCIMLPQLIGYIKCFEINTIMSFKISDDKFLKKYT